MYPPCAYSYVRAFVCVYIQAICPFGEFVHVSVTLMCEAEVQADVKCLTQDSGVTAQQLTLTTGTISKAATILNLTSSQFALPIFVSTKTTTTQYETCLHPSPEFFSYVVYMLSNTSTYE